MRYLCYHIITDTKQWSRSLGLPETSLSFQDLFSLDEEFLAFVPKPVKAVLLLFPSRGRLADSRTEEEQKDGGKWQGKGVWWCKQTVCFCFRPKWRASNLVIYVHAVLTVKKTDIQRLWIDGTLTCSHESA